MCNCCSTDKNMDVLDKMAIDVTIDLGFAGELSVMNRINIEDSTLELTILNDAGEAKVHKRDIRYCPFCGRKLTAD